MRHRNSTLRLKQKPAHAKLLERNLVTSLFLYESIRTTKSRAEVVRPTIDRLIAVAKSRPAHVAIRAINQVVTDKNASRKIMEVLKERYKNRSSGLTRIVPAGSRKGDGAMLVDFMLVDAVKPGSSAAKAEASAVQKEPKKAATKKPSAKAKTAPTTDA